MGHRQINPGQLFGIEQSAVSLAAGTVDALFGAERIKRVLAARSYFPHQF
jgi:hypothetical protein